MKAAQAKAGARVAVWTFIRGRKFEREFARVVTGTVRDQRREEVGELEPHVLIEFEDGGPRAWEPLRKIEVA